jgi:hypothetical protein
VKEKILSKPFYVEIKPFLPFEPKREYGIMASGGFINEIRDCYRRWHGRPSFKRTWGLNTLAVCQKTLFRRIGAF